MTRSRVVCLAAVCMLALAAFTIRAVSLDAQSLWRDEVDSVRFATAPWPDMVGSFTRSGWNGPLYFFLLRGWIALTGTTGYGMRFFSLLFGVLCVPLTYVLGRRLFGRSTGLVAALLVTTSPYLTWYSQEVRMYTLVPALALLAIYGLHRALEGGGWPWWAVQVASTSLAFYCHILAALLVPVQVLAALAWWPRVRKRWRGALFSLACLTLPYLPLAAWQVPLAFQRRETGFFPYSLGEMIQILSSGWSLGMVGKGWSLGLGELGAVVRQQLGPGGGAPVWQTAEKVLYQPWAVVLIGLLAGWGLIGSTILPQPGGREENRAALGLWLVTPVLAVWLISLRQPLFTDRYLIWTAPAFYLLVAVGLISVRRLGQGGGWITSLLLGIILALNGINLVAQASTPIKSDFRAAAAYVFDHVSRRESDPQTPVTSPPSLGSFPFEIYLPLVAGGGPAFDELILFQIPYARYAFDFYFPVDRYPWAEGVYTNHQGADGGFLIGEQEVDRRMEQITQHHDAVWLVATEVDMWDSRRLVQAWLETHMRLEGEVHFNRVDVYRYVRNG